jgi:hypothetical protein
LRRWSLVVLLALVGCTQIIGLDERTYEATAGDGGGVAIAALDCNSYCDQILTSCTVERSQQQFASRETCLGVCAKYPTDPTPSGNTLACRTKRLQDLKATGEDETYCSGAGPGGSAPQGDDETAACGTNCQSFCAMRRSICDPDQVEPDCERKCLALIDLGTFNAGPSFSSGVDTLQCRLAHLSAAASFALKNDDGARKTHCGHSGIRSNQQCDFKDNREIDCASYCQVVGTACSGDAALYESKDQCLKVCEKIPSGSSMDLTAPATRRCIRAGAYDALIAGVSFCPTASPAPDRCGQCESFCLLAEQTCGAQFKGRAECQATCSNAQGAGRNAPYSVKLDQAQTGTTIQCRLLRLTRAMEGNNVASNCGSALGLGPDCD